MNPALMPLFVLAAALPLTAAAPPSVGEKAPDFALSTLQGKSVRLSQMVSKGAVVLVVLRGYPGYQCPFCNRQVQDFIQRQERDLDEEDVKFPVDQVNNEASVPAPDITDELGL